MSVDKLRQAFEAQKLILEQLKQQEEPAKCKHDWKKYRQTIPSERSDRQIDLGYAYQHGNAYFILRACELCKEKQLIDMKVER